MRVPLLDLNRRDAASQKAIEDALIRVARSGRYILGDEVLEFEKRYADYLGIPHVIAVSSGTDALLMALMAFGIGPGDEVICPAYTFFATAGVIARLGATPVWVDSCLDCFNMNIEAIESLVTPRTRAVIAVHLFGQSVKLQRLKALCDHLNLKLIEDAAQAIGTEHQGRKVGGVGDVGCYSFFPTKNLGAMGDAGALATHDEALAQQLRSLRVHGASTQAKYVHDAVGGNFRIDALQAAVLSEKMASLPADITARRAAAALYNERLEAAALQGKISAPAICEAGHAFNQYTIRVLTGGRDAVRTFLAEHQIQSEIYYPVPLHQQPCFSALPPCVLPVAEALSQSCLSLPIFPGITEEEITYVVDTLHAYFSH